MNMNKIIFFWMLIFSSLISISSISWLSMWIGLEINLLSFIPLMSENSLMSSEAMMKYFLIQTLGSSLFLYAFIMMMMFINIKLMNILYMYISLLLKIGSAPFHFWFPMVIEGLSWLNSLILMTWQKLTPLILISYIFNENILIMSIILSLMIGSILGLNQTSIRKLMAYSSISHMGWLLSSLLISNLMMIFYFIIYSFMSISIIFMFDMYNISMINQLYSNFSFNKMNYLFSLNILSYGGLPPFIGFFPKWFIIQYLTSINHFLLAFLLIIFSLINLFYYIRFIFNIMMFKSIQLNFLNFKLINIKLNKFINFMFMMSSISLLIFPSMYLFF
uniref:NADH-ubiquinone oxidoreductase chain 2 n=1 Tax=Dipseliopoda sp. AJB-2020 TaxID=2721793 RepID=A0A7D3UN49_9MUSC|nr:NADH dehydrogenase subunit 2 [Dipseliopoda sp. AJB-2020]